MKENDIQSQKFLT